MKLYPIALKTERGEIARSFISEGIRQTARRCSERLRATGGQSWNSLTAKARGA